MSSICGIIDFENREKLSLKTVSVMGESMYRRGPDERGVYSTDYCIFQHNRLVVRDKDYGTQPMTRVHGGKKYTIIYNGEIYNSEEIRSELKRKGIELSGNSDTETILYAYIIYGDKCPEHLNGIFSFCIIDESEKRVFVARDRFGVKPLFYARLGTSYLISSEIKGILSHPDWKAAVEREGLWQLLFMSPMSISGSGIFKGVKEFLPATAGCFSKEGVSTFNYWRLKAEKWEGTAAEAAEITRDILTDAVSRELKSDAPLAVLLSGGLDSSVVTAIAAREFKERGETLSSYSFQYEGNRENFKASLFQPEGDDEFALYLAQKLGLNHTVLVADNLKIAECLFPAVRARDFPGQADIDSSLLYFCGEIKKKHTVVLSGECSDEIFGGYPWFYRPEMLERDFFPWIHDPFARVNLFDDELTRKKEGFFFVSDIYKKALGSCPLCEGENDEDIAARKATWLSMNHFGASLLERKDRMSMYSSVEARVPFADHRLLEFVYNVPWRIKFENNTEKALLRNAMKDILPDKILWRKKSPYPKTHSPIYEKAVRDILKNRISAGGILSDIIKKDALEELFEGKTGTWFGQLMGAPQLLAWLIQFDYWFELYNVDLIV